MRFLMVITRCRELLCMHTLVSPQVALGFSYFNVQLLFLLLYCSTCNKNTRMVAMNKSLIKQKQKYILMYRQIYKMTSHTQNIISLNMVSFIHSLTLPHPIQPSCASTTAYGKYITAWNVSSSIQQLIYHSIITSNFHSVFHYMM